MNGVQVEVVTEPSYDWPELTRDQVFEMIEMKIRAGTTGAPDKLEQQENWAKVLPIIQGLIGQVIQLRAKGMDAEPLINLMRETVKRFDEKLDVEQFIPAQPTMPSIPMAAGMPADPAALLGAAAPQLQ